MSQLSLLDLIEATPDAPVTAACSACHRSLPLEQVGPIIFFQRAYKRGWTYFTELELAAPVCSFCARPRVLDFIHGRLTREQLQIVGERLIKAEGKHRECGSLTYAEQHEVEKAMPLTAEQLAAAIDVNAEPDVIPCTVYDIATDRDTGLSVDVRRDDLAAILLRLIELHLKNYLASDPGLLYHGPNTHMLRSEIQRKHGFSVAVETLDDVLLAMAADRLIDRIPANYRSGLPDNWKLPGTGADPKGLMRQAREPQKTKRTRKQKTKTVAEPAPIAPEVSPEAPEASAQPARSADAERRHAEQVAHEARHPNHQKPRGWDVDWCPDWCAGDGRTWDEQQTERAKARAAALAEAAAAAPKPKRTRKPKAKDEPAGPALPPVPCAVCQAMGAELSEALHSHGVTWLCKARGGLHMLTQRPGQAPNWSGWGTGMPDGWRWDAQRRCWLLPDGTVRERPSLSPDSHKDTQK